MNHAGATHPTKMGVFLSTRFVETQLFQSKNIFGQVLVTRRPLQTCSATRVTCFPAWPTTPGTAVITKRRLSTRDRRSSCAPTRSRRHQRERDTDSDHKGLQRLRGSYRHCWREAARWERPARQGWQTSSKYGTIWSRRGHSTWYPTASWPKFTTQLCAVSSSSSAWQSIENTFVVQSDKQERIVFSVKLQAEHWNEHCLQRSNRVEKSEFRGRISTRHHQTDHCSKCGLENFFASGQTINGSCK